MVPVPVTATVWVRLQYGRKVNISTVQLLSANFLFFPKRLLSTNVQEFKAYKPGLLFFGLVNLFFKFLHQKVDTDHSAQAAATSTWSERFATYIRQNDVALMESCRKVLKEFEDELMVCEAWQEMFDVLGLLTEIEDPPGFLKTYLQNFAK